jgi:hypothetical protein
LYLEFRNILFLERPDMNQEIAREVRLIDRASLSQVFKVASKRFCGAVVEAPFAFLEVEGEVRPWDAIVTAQVALGLAPEVLDAVDVVSPVGELLAVVDAHVAELDTSSTS